MKARLRFCLALGLTCLLGALALLIGRGSVLAIGGFSPNQELPLPFLAPIGPAPVSFIVRGLEPGVRVDQQGTVYVDSIRGVPGGFDLHRWSPVVDSPANPDNTYPFVYKGQPDGCGVLAGACGSVGIGEGGGDADIAVNFPPSPSDVPNLAMTSLLLAPGVTAIRSPDRGNNFSQPNAVAAVVPGDDRMWNDAIDTSKVYLNYHDVGTFNIEVQRSSDGGMTYLDGFGEAIDPQTFPAAGGVPATNSANVAGQIKVDRNRNSCLSRGNLYSIFIAPDSVTENLSGGPLRSVYVGVSTDVKMGLPVFTFSDFKIFAGPVGSANQGALNLFPALAVDDFGFVYAVWSDNSRIFFSSSGNQGATWTMPPVQVNSCPSTGCNANVFPWIAADANGHVGIVWFGDDRPANSNDPVLEPCSAGSTTCMTAWAKWNVYYAESVNANAASPTFAQVQISDHSDQISPDNTDYIHRGTVSTGGLGGNANRNLGDFFQIAFDPQHRANVAFSDDHKLHPNPVTGHTGFNDPQARRLIRANFTHQLTANSQIVTAGTCAPPPPPPAPGAEKITGGGQIASQTPGLIANFGFIAKNDPPNASLSYHDDGATGGGIEVHSSNVTVPTVTFSGNCATFKGSAKVNQHPGYNYSVNACDNGEPGVGKDTFFISVSGPNFSYRNGGFITSGNIQMHQQ